MPRIEKIEKGHIVCNICDDVVLNKYYIAALRKVIDTIYAEDNEFKLTIVVRDINLRPDRNSKFLRGKPILGIESNESFTLWLDPSTHRRRCSTIEFERLLYHETRHVMQRKNKLLQSVLYSDSVINFIIYLCGGKRKFIKNKDIVSHAFHEIMPAEIDAYLYATAKVGKPYKDRSTFKFDSSMVRWFRKHTK